MAEKPRIDKATGTKTVGHEWDGIEELDTPMPRWWLYMLYATIIWGVVYVILYPAWPLIDRATAGVLGWSSRDELRQDLAAEHLPGAVAALGAHAVLLDAQRVHGEEERPAAVGEGVRIPQAGAPDRLRICRRRQP